MNCFLLYCQAKRNKVKQENQHLSNSDITSLLGKAWRETSETEKQKYKQEANEQRSVSAVYFSNILVLISKFSNTVQSKRNNQNKTLISPTSTSLDPPEPYKRTQLLVLHLSYELPK